MDLYVANSTRQDVVFHFRLPEKAKMYRLTLSSGRQDMIKDMSQNDVEAIVKHLERYGAVKRSGVRGKLKEFVGYIYSLDKPINEDEFHYGSEEVIDAAQNRSVVEATKAAMASELVSRNKVVKGQKAKRTVVGFEQEGGPQSEKIGYGWRSR
jgi:hypothetical protein